MCGKDKQKQMQVLLYTRSQGSIEYKTGAPVTGGARVRSVRATRSVVCVQSVGLRWILVLCR